MTTVELSTTSSGINGWSSLSGFLECPAKAAAGRAAALERGDVPWDLYPEEGKPVATLTGSIYGALIESWLMGAPVPPSATLLWNGQSLNGSHPLTVAEAWRLVDARTAKGFDFGKVIATQVDVVIPEAVFGLEITGNLDLVVERNGEIWIGDLKTEGRAESTLFDKFSLRQQLWIYCLGYHIKTGLKPAGCFIDIIIKNKEPRVEMFLYEGLTARRFAWLKDSVARVKSAMADPRPTPSLNACIAYSRKCVMLENGMCNLIKGA